MWLNDGQGHYTATVQVLSSIAGGTSQFTDADSDGDMDIIARHLGGFRVRLNDGQGNMTSGFFTNSGWRLADNLVTADIDDDGDLDIASTSGDFTEIWRNHGDGTYEDTGQRLTGAAGHSRFRFGDVDADGDLDLVANRVWLNDGTGVFQQGQSQLDGISDLGDIDGDGDLDAVFAEFGMARIYENVDLLTDITVEIEVNPRYWWWSHIFFDRRPQQGSCSCPRRHRPRTTGLSGEWSMDMPGSRRRELHV